jgi:hypothetical protein
MKASKVQPNATSARQVLPAPSLGQLDLMFVKLALPAALPIHQGQLHAHLVRQADS